MILMLGNRYCKDCAHAEKVLRERGVDFEFHDFSDNMEYMRECLRLRDSAPNLFRQAVQEGNVGIPVFRLEDGRWTHALEDCL